MHFEYSIQKDCIHVNNLWERERENNLVGERKERGGGGGGGRESFQLSSHLVALSSHQAPAFNVEPSIDSPATR